MTQTTLVGPPNASLPFNTGDSLERGNPPKAVIDALNTMLSEIYAAAVTTVSPLQYVDVTISSAELLALNATPKTIVAAPAAGFALIFESVVAYKAAGTAYVVGGTSDLSIKYTNASGLEVTEIETTGFLDQTTAQTRTATAFRAASGISSITPVAASPLIMMTLVAELTTGNSPLKLRVYYRVVPTVL